MTEYRSDQLMLFGNGDQRAKVVECITALLEEGQQPSAWELVNSVEDTLGRMALWDLETAIGDILSSKRCGVLGRDYLESLLSSDDLARALRGADEPRAGVESSIDALLRECAIFAKSNKYREMIEFVARFRDYSPYNNMLVRLQNPSCGYFATQAHWRNAFGRTLKEDARPMIILAPMSPVLTVFDIDQTEGNELPAGLTEFAHFGGCWEPRWLEFAVENAAVHDLIRVDVKVLSSTNAGFATTARSDPQFKMRIAIHEGLDGPSRLGVLCHELAHIYLGHLGADHDRWWPGRRSLNRHAMEVEAESVAYIVTSRLGLSGASAAYVSQHLHAGDVPIGVSLDNIAKVAGRILTMTDRKIRARPPRRVR